jgi:hypothetical protein
MVEQTNVRNAGPVPVTAGEDLTGKEGLFVEVNNSSGPVLVLADNMAEAALMLLVDGAANGETVYAEALQMGKYYRGIAKGAVNPGDRLCLADPSVEADKGKLRALPAASGTYRCIGIAMEVKTDGQSILFYATGSEAVTVD